MLGLFSKLLFLTYHRGRHVEPSYGPYLMYLPSLEVKGLNGTLAVACGTQVQSRERPWGHCIGDVAIIVGLHVFAKKSADMLVPI